MTPKISHSQSFLTLHSPTTQKSHPLTILFLTLVGVGLGMLYIQYTRSLKNRLLSLVAQSANHLNQSHYPEALNTCKEALTCQPEANLLARIHLIMSYSYEKMAVDGNYNLAEGSLSKADESKSEDPRIQREIQHQTRNLKARICLAEGNRQLKDQKFVAAIQSYKEGLAQKPLDETLYQAINTHLFLARGAKNMKRTLWDLAIEYYQAGLASNCPDVDVRATFHVRIGNAYVEKKEYALAEASYSQALQCNPNDPDVQVLIQNAQRDLQVKKLLDQADQKVATKEHAAALGCLDQASGLKPSKDLQSVISNHRASCFLNLGQLDRMQGAYDQALQNFQTALCCNPTDINLAAHIYLNKGMLHSSLGQYALAEESYIKASECQPGDLYIQGMIKGEKRNLEAKKILSKGLQNTADQKYDEAFQNYEAALACNPSSGLQTKIHANITKCKIDELIYRGQQNLKKQAYHSALQNFKDALALNPSDIHDQVRIFSEMGNAHIGLKQYHFAEHCLLLAMNFKPSDPELQGQIYYQLARYYNEKPQPDYDQALLYFSEALRFNFGKKMPARISRGILYDHYKKDPQKAIEDYQTVIDSTCARGLIPNPHLAYMARLLKVNTLRRQALSDGPLQSNLEILLQETSHISLAAGKLNPPLHAVEIEAFYQKALCLHALKRLEEAAKFYSTVIDLIEHDYTKASALCDRALCYEQQGKDQEALKDYEQASKYALKEKERVDLQTCIDRAPLKSVLGTPASYQDSDELTLAIRAGIIGMQEKLRRVSES